MNRMFRFALVAAAALSCAASIAHADNFQVKDATATTISKCSQVVSTIHHECQISEGVTAAGLPVKMKVADDGTPLNPTTAPTLANQAAGNTKLDTLIANTAAATPAGNNAIGDVGSASFSATCAVLTLPGTGGTYASGDLAANSATAGSVTPLACVVARYSGGPISITGAQILTSTTGLTAASFRLHGYTAIPTVTNGNDGVFLSTASGHFCRIDITLDLAFSNGALGRGAPNDSASCTRVLSASQTVYLLVEARGAYAWTAAQTLTVTLEGYN